MEHPEILGKKTPNQRLWLVLGFVLIITVFEACAQTSLKTARARRKHYLIPLGILFYTIVALLLFYCYKYEGMGHTNLVWSCLSIIVAILIGCLLFNEPHNRYTYLAIVLAILAIYFAHRADELG